VVAGGHSSPAAGRRPDGRRRMKVLVTGGAGFIGGHVVEALEAAGHKAVVFDRALRANHDLTNPVAVAAHLDGVDVVCHLAARVGLGIDFADVDDYVRDNDVGTATLLSMLHASGFRGRLVLASSMVVYGEGQYRCPAHGLVRPGPRSPERLAAGCFEPPCPRCGGDLMPETVTEDDPVDPRTIYAATKLHQEHLCFTWGREVDAAVVALRYHNVYGPRMPVDTPYAGVASIFRSALRRGQPPRVYEDGRQRRDFIHVTDVARATVAALEADPAVSGAFNVASGEPHTVGEMAVAMADAFGPNAPRPVIAGEWRLGDVRHIVASPDRADQMLGFRAKVPFAEGMAGLALATDEPPSSPSPLPRHPLHVSPGT
jgi:dTDP-L-rhamnose 4-epimerase